MPRIAEFKQMDGHLWVRADIPDLENGSAWWSPKEQRDNRAEGYLWAIEDQPKWIKKLIHWFGEPTP